MYIYNLHKRTSTQSLIFLSRKCKIPSCNAPGTPCPACMRFATASSDMTLLALCVCEREFMCVEGGLCVWSVCVCMYIMWTYVCEFTLIHICLYVWNTRISKQNTHCPKHYHTNTCLTPKYIHTMSHDQFICDMNYIRVTRQHFRGKVSLQRVAACCSVLQCAAVCYSVL